LKKISALAIWATKRITTTTSLAFFQKKREGLVGSKVRPKVKGMPKAQESI